MFKSIRAVAAAAAIACAAPSAMLISAGAAYAQMASEDASVVQAGAVTGLKYSAPQVRTRARALGYGGVAQYASIPGSAAALRVAQESSFLVALPSSAQPTSLVTLARLEPRKNNTREVVIGGGYMSFSTGIHPDRIVAVEITPAAKQTGAPAGNTIYTVKPMAALPPGEYALIVSSATGGQTGFAGRFYDFGVQ
jgi:hypothetical protein